MYVFILQITFEYLLLCLKVRIERNLTDSLDLPEDRSYLTLGSNVDF